VTAAIAAALALASALTAGSGASALTVGSGASALTVGQVDGVRVIGAARAPADVHGEDRSFAPDIAWSTAPRIGARARLAIDRGTAAGAALRVIARAGDDPLVIAGEHGVVFAADAADPSNAALARWGYWPYLVDAAARRADGRAEVAFADWPGAPVPHRGLTALWLGVSGACLFALALAFARARRRSTAGPDATARPDAVASEAARLLGPLGARANAAEAAWTRPGFARPLAGFFLFLSATLLALGPYVYVTAALVPSRVQPFPDVDGAWAPVEEVALLFWSIADLGLTAAFVQRFARYRVADPPAALRAAQLFVWWQLASGVALFVAGGALACLVLPHTRYALLARVVLLRAGVQLFGVTGVFTTFFQAAQRFDYQLGLDLLDNRLLLVALPIPLVLVGRAVGRAHPALGETGGALCGIAAGVLAAHLCTFVVGLVLYRRLALPLRPLFGVHFDKSTFVDLLKFGAGVVAGKAPFFIANTIEIALATNLLAGYPTWLGIKGLLATRLVFVIYFAYPFFDSAVPAVAEALAARKLALARYYVARYLQFGHLFAAIVVAFLVGAGRPLALRALGGEWAPVAAFLPIAAGVSLLLPATWMSDSLLKGAGRPGLDAALLTGEQALRVALLAVLLPRVGFVAFYLASLGSIVAKNVAAWTINQTRILRLELRAWPTFVAPAATGAALYALLAGAAYAVPAGRTAAFVLFAASALAAFPVGFFACGALGGFDPAALDEIARAAALAGPMRPVARVLDACARAGARVSPLGAPRTALADAAAREADELAAGN
jgi:O-antigen/teichoic acid export membrane protein